MPNTDTCDRCGKRRFLYHNEATGLSLCDACDIEVDFKARARKLVYEASQANEGITLSASEVKWLWRSILDDGVERVKLNEKVEKASAFVKAFAETR